MAFRRRLLKLFLLTCVALLVVWLRVVQLQTVEGETWTAAARAKRERVLELPAPRGRIVDRHGQVLARDLPIFQLAVVGWEWERRHRERCDVCGTTAYRHPKAFERPPRPCRCGAPASAVERLAPASPDELEQHLGLDPGQLSERADGRLSDVEATVKKRRARLEEEGQADFLIHDDVELTARDLLHRPFVIVRRLDPDAVRLVELDEEGRYRGLRVVTALRRDYPEGGPASQFLGYTSVVRDYDELERLRALYGRNVTLDTRVGRSALERGLESLLLGQTGSVRLARDDDGAFTDVVAEQPPVRGREIRLALSAKSCLRAEKALSDWGGAEGYFPSVLPSGGFVAVYADDGAIAAWGEMPRMSVAEDLDRLFDETNASAVFDPDLGQWVPKEGLRLPEGLTLDEWRRQLSKPAPLQFSRVSQVAVEPGSTFKVFIGLGLLEGLHHMRPGATLPFRSAFICRGRPEKPGCHAHRDVSFEGAIGVSCNRYFALSLRDFPAYFAVYRRSVPALLERLGFGGHTGTDVWGEKTGIFLSDYVDLDPRVVAHEAVRAVSERRGAAPGQLQLRVERGVPGHVAGRGAARLRTLLEEVLDGTLDVQRTERLVLTLASSPGEKRMLELHVRLHGRYRPEGPPPQPIDWKALRVAVGRLYGTLEGGYADDGSVSLSFTLDYHEKIGRATGDPLMVLPDQGRNFAIGQGPIAATPLQMVRAVAVLANRGRLVTPHAAVLAGDDPLPTQTVELGLDAADIDRVRAGMRAAVEGPQGTATGAVWHAVPATVYGKTGTSQVGSGWRMGLQPDEGPWHHWFVGFAEAPGRRTLAFACVLHSRTEGAASRTSVHAVRDFLQWWFTEGPDVR